MHAAHPLISRTSVAAAGVALSLLAALSALAPAAAPAAVANATNACGNVYSAYWYLTGVITNASGKAIATLPNSWDWDSQYATPGDLVPTDNPSVPNGDTDGLCLWGDAGYGLLTDLEAWGYYVTDDGAIWQFHMGEANWIIPGGVGGGCTQLNTELTSKYTCPSSTQGSSGESDAQVNAKFIPFSDSSAPPVSAPSKESSTDHPVVQLLRHLQSHAIAATTTSLSVTVSNQTTNVSGNPPDPAGTPEAIRVLPDSWTLAGGAWTQPGGSPPSVAGIAASGSLAFTVSPSWGQTATVYGYFVTFDGSIWQLKVLSSPPLLAPQITCSVVSHADPSASPPMPSTACPAKVTSPPGADPVTAEAIFVTP